MIDFWTTYDGRTIPFLELTHSHLSNIYHLYKLTRHVNDDISENEILSFVYNRLMSRYGTILPYRPNTDFKAEIEFLDNEGYLKGNKIVVDGIEIGYIHDVDINELEKNIGSLVIKHKSNNKFKSGNYVNTIKGVILHPQLEIPAYTFEEDESYVECRRCMAFPKVIRVCIEKDLGKVK